MSKSILEKTEKKCKTTIKGKKTADTQRERVIKEEQENEIILTGDNQRANPD